MDPRVFSMIDTDEEVDPPSLQDYNDIGILDLLRAIFWGDNPADDD